MASRAQQQQQLPGLVAIFGCKPWADDTSPFRGRQRLAHIGAWKCRLAFAFQSKEGAALFQSAVAGVRVGGAVSSGGTAALRSRPPDFAA